MLTRGNGGKGRGSEEGRRQSKGIYTKSLDTTLPPTSDRIWDYSLSFHVAHVRDLPEPERLAMGEEGQTLAKPKALPMRRGAAVRLDRVSLLVRLSQDRISPTDQIRAESASSSSPVDY